MVGTTAGSGGPSLAQNETDLFKIVSVIRWILSRVTGSGGGRTILQADTTYYVRTDGNDNNVGTVDSASGAFLTIQKAVDVVSGTLDRLGFNVTIQVRAGTYSGGVVLKAGLGSQPIVLTGDTTTPSNVVISAGKGVDCILGQQLGNTVYNIYGFRLVQTGGIGGASGSNGNGLFAIGSTKVNLNQIDFNAASFSHVRSTQGALVVMDSQTVRVSGNASRAFDAAFTANISMGFTSVLWSNNPAFTSATVHSADASEVSLFGANLTSGAGGVTGPRYLAEGNAIIRTNTGDPNFIPGNSAGTAIQGGLYV